EHDGAGKIICTEVGEPKIINKGGAVRLPTKNEWRMSDGVKIMDETRILTFHDLGKARLIIFDIDLIASVCPITFADTKEGAMAIRINDYIAAPGKSGKGKGKMQNAEGKTAEVDMWGYKSAWADYSGPLGGKSVGLTVFCDPQNKYSSCWHARGYGLMAANP